MFDDCVYVFILCGEVIDLLKDVMFFDFVYVIYSEIGYCCIGVKVVGKIVLFIYNFKMGD